MYKVMIVEDEIPIRNIIARIIDWKSLGFELVYQADNGQIGLTYLESHPVDLVITDISMPFMDGLELCKHIRRIKPSMTIVILTGYNEFEYARKAIKLNVSNYLLKPITKNTFTKTLSSIKDEMDEKYANQRNVDFLREQYVKSKDFLKNKYLMNVVLGYRQTTYDNVEFDLDIDLDGKWFMVGVIDFLDNENAQDGMESTVFWGEDRPLLEFAILNLTKELLGKINQNIVFFGPGNKLCFILKSKVALLSDEQNEVIACLEDVTVQIANLFKINATIGLSDAYIDVNELSLAYQDAISALEYRVLEGSERVILKSLVENKRSFAFHKIEEQLIRLEYSIKVGDIDGIKKVIQFIFSVVNYEKINIDGFRTMLLKMTLSIFKAYNDIRNLDEKDVILDYSIFSKVFEMNDFNEIKDYYIKLCEKLSSKIQQLRENDQKNHVKDACDFIADNYQDPSLTLEDLCKQLYLSPGHFSRLFKKTTGENFVDYLTKVRMDRAKYLLANTNTKIYEISRSIGYEDPNYFSYNFKKNVHMTPSQWRNRGEQL